MRHRGIHEIQNDNFCPLVYTLEIEINLLDLNPKYPKYPKNLGEKIRKARMDKGLLQKELAEQIGVTKDTVRNWEIGRTEPIRESVEKIKEFIGNRT